MSGCTVADVGPHRRRRRPRPVHRSAGRGGHGQGPGPGPGHRRPRGEQPRRPGRRGRRPASEPAAGRRRWSSVVDARRGEVFAAAYRFDRAGDRGDGRPSRSIPGRSAPTGAEPIDARRRWRPGCSTLGDGGRTGHGGGRRCRPLPPAPGRPTPARPRLGRRSCRPRRRWPWPDWPAAAWPPGSAPVGRRRPAARLPATGRRPDQLGAAGPAADGAAVDPGRPGPSR